MSPNRSFSRRVGKGLSKSQKNLLGDTLAQYLWSNNSLDDHPVDRSIILEIGFGMGEHFIHQACCRPDQLLIGVEAYLNGIANVLKLALDANIRNILLWPDDLDLMIKDIPLGCLSGIYLLFPDPWPKRKHHKKRFLNTERLHILQSKLKPGGFFIFASDVDDYFFATKDLVVKNNSFKPLELDSDFLNQPNDYIVTKYHNKAQIERRTVRFLHAIKA